MSAACETHCCSIHGCKYGHDKTCEVATGKKPPRYPHNNGCEVCEYEYAEKSQAAASLGLREVFGIGYISAPDWPINSTFFKAKATAERVCREYNQERSGGDAYCVISRYESAWKKV